MYKKYDERIKVRQKYDENEKQTKMCGILVVNLSFHSNYPFDDTFVVKCTRICATKTSPTSVRINYVFKLSELIVKKILALMFENVRPRVFDLNKSHVR